MPLQVNTQPDTFGPFAFTFRVPGQQRWRLRSVRADVARASGGAPDRAYLLTVTSGHDTVAQAGADDAGDEPGTTSITWCNAPGSAVSAGDVGIVVAPNAPLSLEGGYVITVSIINPVLGDAWIAGVAWYDFVYTTQ